MTFRAGQLASLDVIVTQNRLGNHEKDTRTEVYQLFNEPNSKSALPSLLLESQTIYRADRNTYNICRGQWYNSGIGILQLALNPKWGRPFDNTPKVDNPTVKNPFIRIIANPVEGKDNDQIRDALRSFLELHYRAPRIDVYVNGMATVQLQMERTVDGIQKRLDVMEGVSGLKTGDGTAAEHHRYPQSMHVPVIGVYNLTSVSMDGKAVFFDPWDAKDILDNQEDAAFPGRETRNQDTKRLIIVLRELIRVLWDPDFVQTIRGKWQHEPEGIEGANAWLQNIRKRLTLHAHSQGARVAAVAMTRLESIVPDRQLNEDAGASIDVASQYDYVDYGNGAGISMWWKQNPGYRSYLHHVNRSDAVALSVGLYPPTKIKSPSVDDCFAGLNAVVQANGFLMAPNPLYKNPEGSRWLNIGRNLATSLHPDISGNLFARYVEAISGLWNHNFVIHDSFCKSANADNHDILGAYICNLTRGEMEVKNYTYVNTPWSVGAGYFGYYQGPPVCENGDCGGTDSTTTDLEDGSKLKGLLEIRVDGTLPIGLNAKIEIQGSSQSTYPSPITFTDSTLQHPLLPGTYKIWADPIQESGKTYWGRVEDLNGNVLTEVDIRGGQAVSLRVNYAQQ